MSIKVQSISIPINLLEAGKRRAQEQGRSFSGHIRWLLQNDEGSTDERPQARKRNAKPAR